MVSLLECYNALDAIVIVDLILKQVKSYTGNPDNDAADELAGYPELL